MRSDQDMMKVSVPEDFLLTNQLTKIYKQWNDLGSHAVEKGIKPKTLTSKPSVISEMLN